MWVVPHASDFAGDEADGCTDDTGGEAGCKDACSDPDMGCEATTGQEATVIMPVTLVRSTGMVRRAYLGE